MKKRILSLALTLALVLAFIPAAAMAADTEFPYDLNIPEPEPWGEFRWEDIPQSVMDAAVRVVIEISGKFVDRTDQEAIDKGEEDLYVSFSVDWEEWYAINYPDFGGDRITEEPGRIIFDMSGLDMELLRIGVWHSPENIALITRIYLDTDKDAPFELTYTDIGTISGEQLENIRFVTEYELMAGSGGRFMPFNNARNAQFLAILSRLAGAGVTDGAVWYQPYVDWARDYGIIGAGEFSADANMTREDMALWLYRYITISGISLPKTSTSPQAFTDISGLSAEQQTAVIAMYDWGIIRGSNPGVTFGTGNSSERVALANVLARFVRMLP